MNRNNNCMTCQIVSAKQEWDVMIPKIMQWVRRTRRRRSRGTAGSRAGRRAKATARWAPGEAARTSYATHGMGSDRWKPQAAQWCVHVLSIAPRISMKTMSHLGLMRHQQLKWNVISNKKETTDKLLELTSIHISNVIFTFQLWILKW